MRVAWLPQLAISAALTGCSVSVSGAIPGMHGHAAVYHIASSPVAIHSMASGADPVSEAKYASLAAVAPAPPTTVIDVPTIYRTVLRLPSIVTVLDRDLLCCTGAIILIGALNALLLLRLPNAFSGKLGDLVVRRVGASVDGMLEGAKLEMLAAAATATATATMDALPGRLDAERTCACGSAIGARSRSGLCRSCAQVLRLARLRFSQPPAKRALPSMAPEPSEPWEHSTTAIVARSRVGECRQYYAVDFRASSEQGEIFFEMFADRSEEPAIRTVSEYAPPDSVSAESAYTT
jgi:hypothetical protein